MNPKTTINYSLVSERGTHKADWKEGVRFLGEKPRMHSGLYNKVKECFKKIILLDEEISYL